MEENSGNVQKTDSRKKKDSTVIIVVACIAILMHRLGFILDIRFWFLGRFLGLIDLLLLLNLKKGIFRKKVLIEIVAVIGLCLVLFFFGENISKALTPSYELTEEEKAWLKKYYSDDAEQIEKGRLKSFQKGTLEIGREVKEYLKEKYPEYEFEIRYYCREYYYHQFGMKEKKSEYPFFMEMRKEDGEINALDNFYAYLMEDKYRDYMEKEIKKKVENVAAIEVSMPSMMGKEYDSSMTVEDIVSGRVKLSPWVHIHISAKGMTEDECASYTLAVNKVIEEINASGSYIVRFWDMTKEEMLAAEEYEKLIYMDDIGIAIKKD